MADTLKQRAKEYVELEANAKVRSIRVERKLDRATSPWGDTVFRVRIADRNQPEWWVIGGGTPMNLYSVRDFPNYDLAYSLHLGLVLRLNVRSNGRAKQRRTPQNFDAFICHASEDKAGLVKPLAMALKRLGFDIWYDEHEMRVGDSLRRSIDKGLSKSRFGIVVLSKSFFSKEWPKYELDGLTAREVQGKKVILPIWHGVTRAQVFKRSPTLADRVALDTGKRTVKEMARLLGDVLMEPVLTRRSREPPKKKPAKGARYPQPIF